MPGWYPRLSSKAVFPRPVAQLAERRSPKPKVGGSKPSWPAKMSSGEMNIEKQNIIGKNPEMKICWF